MAVTIRDVAARCGLSVSTVSKAFNNYTDISTDTRELVQRTAREIGYFPNAVARTLKTNRSYNLGVLFNDDSESGLTHAFFAAVLESFKKEIEKRGYDLTFISHHMGKTGMTYLEHCHYRNVDGVFAMCANFYHPEVTELLASELPCVTVDHCFHGRSGVLSDNEDGMYQLVRKAVSLGHKRIAFVGGQPCMVSDKRRSGYLKGMAEANLPVDAAWVTNALFDDPAASYEVVRQLLRLPNAPTCIMLPDDHCCLGGLQAAAELGLRVPEDLSLTGYDGTREAQLLRPRLTTISQDTATLGRTAAQLLVERIEKVDAPVQLINIPVKMLEGESLGPVKEA